MSCSRVYAGTMVQDFSWVWPASLWNSGHDHPIFPVFRVNALQKGKWSTFKHLLTNPDLSIRCNNIWEFLNSRKEQVFSQSQSLIFRFLSCRLSDSKVFCQWRINQFTPAICTFCLEKKHQPNTLVGQGKAGAHKEKQVFCWHFFSQGWLIGTIQNCVYWRSLGGKSKMTPQTAPDLPPLFFAGWKSFLWITFLELGHVTN